MSISKLFTDPEQYWRTKLAKLTRKIWKPAYHGFGKIPDTGACVIICNHVSYVDGMIINAGCKRPVRFVIDGHIYNAPIVHYFMKLNRAIPILPNKQSVTEALEAIEEGLNAGDAICIFPEGRLTYTGSLSRFRPGIEWILKQNPVPVYPMAISGLWGSMFSRKYRKSWFRWWPRKWKLRVTAVCGEVIQPEDIKVNHLQRIILKLKQQAMEVSSRN